MKKILQILVGFLLLIVIVGTVSYVFWNARTKSITQSDFVLINEQYFIVPEVDKFIKTLPVAVARIEGVAISKETFTNEYNKIRDYRIDNGVDVISNESKLITANITLQRLIQYQVLHQFALDYYSDKPNDVSNFAEVSAEDKNIAALLSVGYTPITLEYYDEVLSRGLSLRERSDINRVESQMTRLYQEIAQNYDIRILLGNK